MNKKIYSFSLGALAVMLLCFTSANAQMMGGRFSLHAELSSGGVALSWEQPEEFTAAYYLVYRAQVGVNSLDSNFSFNFSQIDSTTATTYVDTVTPPVANVFVYMVKAINDSGQVRLSSMSRVYAGFQNFGRDRVTITSQPPLTATVDSLYQYQVKAVSSDSTAVLTYRLDDHPMLMTIDSTGLINWIPQTRGWYEVEVIVKSSSGGRAVQEYAIRVAGLQGTIAGTVTDSNNVPIPNVIVRLYQRDMDMHFDYSARTDSNGYYAIHGVDAGKYLVRAIPTNSNYLPEWYDNAFSMMNATPISVTDTTTQVANFTLQNRFFALPKYTVSGSVTDTTGVAIKGALVVFARAEFTFNMARDNQDQWENGDNYRDMFQNMYQESNEDHDFRLDGNSPYVFKTYTDSDGVYSDTLPKGAYIAFVKATGYHRVFFNNESDFLSADILSLVSDTTGVNFTLTPLPQVVLGQISGSVFDSTTSSGVAARIIAFRDVWNYRDTLHMHVAGAYFADADSSGAYTLNNLPPGYYKILAIPLGAYAPSFYSTTGPTVRWSQATAVPISGNTTTGIDIYVMPLPSAAAGYTSINGSVSTSSTTGGGMTGVSGAIVYATDANGNVAGYGVSGSNGDYTIAGLAPGTYDVFTEAVGFTSSSTSTSSPTYSTTGTAQPSTSNFTVSPETPTAVQQKPIQPTNYTLDQNYPNPFNPTTQIAFSIPQEEHVTIAIYNILGERVATLLSGNLSAGSHLVTWNARNSSGEMLPTGVYFYQLSTPHFTAVKKMLLLK
ncbi:MAG: carboxypeptidase regulatory-like domain-containing protein [Bacteroidetes bacterium]|jgi:protocatechuate 3,4-dioxygenase beta subunit|nr:carboxypeptidase regulatory-like domain-containing protein [Bacteroidota bacterium]